MGTMLRQSLTYQMASISEDSIRPASRLFRSRFGLDVHELRVLRLIDDQPGVTFTSLAAQTKFERSATSRILARLIKAGLARREIDEADARHFKMFVTAEGQALRQRADPLSLELEEMILAALPEAERRQFRASLDKVTAWLANHFQENLAERYPEALDASQRRLIRAAKKRDA
ncbi:MAG: winged helix-turn-helix transcriptional regulator [Paracoccaceae bacterium]|nr:winged helix-turn-helix transcriptional regulator [Paracoccaceae bacterium]